MMTVLLTGWSGPASALPRLADWSARAGPAPACHPSTEITYSLTYEDTRVRLAASSSGFVIQKLVRPDGGTEVTLERDRDLVSIISTHAAVVVARGRRSVTINVNGDHDEQLARVRALLLGSSATRAARTLATVLEESGTDAPEKIGIRLSGALVAHIDGDEGAVRRLSRELQARYAAVTQRAKFRPPDYSDVYHAGVMKAATDLETCLESFSFFNPMRQVCSFVWVHQVERCWRAYVSRGSGPLQ
jgi:hypothetical protein